MRKNPPGIGFVAIAFAAIFAVVAMGCQGEDQQARLAALFCGEYAHEATPEPDEPDFWDEIEYEDLLDAIEDIIDAELSIDVGLAPDPAPEPDGDQEGDKSAEPAGEPDPEAPVT